MKKSKLTGEQIAHALRQVDLGVTVAEVCRKMGISEATFYRWKQLYGGMGPSELRKMRQLEAENQKLKRLVADLRNESPTSIMPDNAFVESFNGRLRDECLNAHWFLSLDDARAKIEAWRWDFNENRPHTSLEFMTPAEFASSARVNPRPMKSQGLHSDRLQIWDKATDHCSLRPPRSRAGHNYGGLDHRCSGSGVGRIRSLLAP